MSIEDVATQGARSILSRCLDLSEGGRFVLLIDETTGEVVDPFYLAAQELGVQLTTLFFSSRQQLEVSGLGGVAKSAIEEADAALLAHTAEDSRSRFRTKLVSEWRGATRLGTMPGANRFILEVASRTNYPFIIDQCRRLTLPLLHGRQCIVTTHDRSGRPYELKFLLGGVERPPVQSTGILGPRAWGNVPSGEIFTAPLEESADGEYLVNGAIGVHPIKDEEAVLTFRNGRLVDYRFLPSGQPVGWLEEIARISRDREDPNWDVIAEFGIGVNDGIPGITGYSLLDEKIFGTVHVAIGHNVGWQGKNRAQHHLDIITGSPTVTIDGRSVIERGKHVVKPDEFDDLSGFSPNPRYQWQEGVDIAAVKKDRTRRVEGELLIEWITQSGRNTEVPIANDQTRQIVNAFFHYPGHFPSLNSLLAGDLKPLPPEHVYKFLSLLWTYGIAEPE